VAKERENYFRGRKTNSASSMSLLILNTYLVRNTILVPCFGLPSDLVTNGVKWGVN
jgi:hypothetical protein